MVAQVKTYTVNAAKHEGWWMLTSPDAPGAVSQVRALSQAEDHAREAIAFVMGVAEAEVDVRIVPTLPEGLAETVREAKDSSREAEQLQKFAAELSRAAVAELMAAGLKGAEVAVVLDVSPQRVSQLARTKDAAMRTAREMVELAGEPKPKRVHATKKRSSATRSHAR